MIPRVTIIRPSWLDVEKATIFLMSFWVRAQIAVNRVVIAPKHSIAVRIVLLLEMRGWKRISRKTPATTIVLEWSSADTGVGPSIADGSHGCSPNWADLPVAAITSPMSGMMFGLSIMKICCRSHELVFVQNQAIARMNPMSPMRLYKMAWRAAVFASDRPYHHPISRNDMIPTPSHPMNSWNRLLAEVKMTIVMRKRSRYLINRSRLGSECMYHMENSMIDHVTNRATGRKMMEKKSNFRLSDNFMDPMVIQCQLVIITSVPVLKNEDSGIRLMKNAYLIHRVT